MEITYEQDHGKHCILREKCRKMSKEVQKTTKKTREIADFSENRGFGPKSRNLLRPWNRDFLEGQIGGEFDNL